MSQYILSYIIKSHRHIQMGTSKERKQIKIKLIIDQLYITFQPELRNIFQMMGYS